MPAQTEKKTLTAAAWTKLAENVTTVAVQINNPGNVMIIVRDSTLPDPTVADDFGIIIGRNLDRDAPGFSAGNMPNTTIVWGRSLKDASEEVVVLSY
jgi:hypothetical protein